MEGLGPRSIRVIYQHLRITSLDELERACRAGLIAGLPGIGAATEEKLLRTIDRARRPAGRLLLPDALLRGEAMAQAIRSVPGVLAVELTGSARRRKETVQDLDLCVAADDRAAVASKFVSLPEVIEILVRGDGRASVKLDGGHQADLRVVPDESFGAALHYFTGSQLHNVYLRARANRRGLKISDHGIFWRRDERRLSPGRTEAEIFASVGLPFIPPELRENLGELEAAERGQLPHLLEARDLRGDLRALPQGTRAVAPLARAAKALGYAWLGVAQDPAGPDPSKRLRAAEDREGVELLAVAQVPIRADGSLGFDARQLAPYDWTVGIPDPAEGNAWPGTAALVAALRTGLLDCLAHPSGRRLPADSRPRVEVDRLIQETRRMGVALELDADPTRLDLHSAGCKQARELGVPIALASTAREPAELARIQRGVDHARRGWLELSNVLNGLRADQVIERGRRRRAGASPSKPRRRAAPKPPVRDLRDSLRDRPLAPPVRDRLDRFFRGESDPELEAALRELGPNPLQVTFELLSSPAGET